MGPVGACVYCRPTCPELSPELPAVLALKKVLPILQAAHAVTTSQPMLRDIIDYLTCSRLRMGRSYQNLI